jgi:hypothetical protein
VARIVVHGGWFKTGTTAIQKFLWDNRAALRQKGIYYPATGLRRKPRFAPKHCFWEGKARTGFSADRIWPALRREIRRSGCDTVVLSNEGFSGADAARITQLVTELQPHSLRFCCYLRRQDEYLESQYNQLTKNGTSLHRDVLTAAELEPLRHRMSYLENLNRWAFVLGDKHMTVRVYDRKRLAQGDVVRDFLNNLNIDDSNLQFTERSRNNSLPTRLIPLKRSLNQYIEDAELNKNVNKWIRDRASEEEATVSLLTDPERKELFTAYDAENQEIFRRFGQRNEGFGRACPSFSKVASKEPDPEDIRDLLYYLLTIWGN